MKRFFEVTNAGMNARELINIDAIDCVVELEDGSASLIFEDAESMVRVVERYDEVVARIEEAVD